MAYWSSSHVFTVARQETKFGLQRREWQATHPGPLFQKPLIHYHPLESSTPPPSFPSSYQSLNLFIFSVYMCSCLWGPGDNLRCHSLAWILSAKWCWLASEPCDPPVYSSPVLASHVHRPRHPALLYSSIFWNRNEVLVLAKWFCTDWAVS